MVQGQPTTSCLSSPKCRREPGDAVGDEASKRRKVWPKLFWIVDVSGFAHVCTTPLPSQLRCARGRFHVSSHLPLEMAFKRGICHLSCPTQALSCNTASDFTCLGSEHLRILDSENLKMTIAKVLQFPGSSGCAFLLRVRTPWIRCPLRTKKRMASISRHDVP